MGTRSSSVISALAVVAFASAAAAAPAEQVPDESPDVSYLWDGGALVFFWGALAGRLLIGRYADPPDEPRLFPADEGGAAKAAWQVPGWTVSATGVVVAATMVLGDDPSRWHHVKGFAESLATTYFVTGAIKTTFGRHRPDWQAGDPTEGQKSFPSGHTSQAFAIATYSIFYLRTHPFARRRGDRTLPWWEVAAYGGILAGATAVAVERVVHNKHHVSDVGAGALLGSATSAVFFLYQEGRYRAHAARRELILAPAIGPDGAGLSLTGRW